MQLLLIISILFSNLIYVHTETEINEKYLFYDINPVEGFNLRRDVYLRIANLIDSLNKYDKMNSFYICFIRYQTSFSFDIQIGKQQTLNGRSFFRHGHICLIGKMSSMIKIFHIIGRNFLM